MADTLQTGEFWLPPEFLTDVFDDDDDLLMDEQNLRTSGLNPKSKSNFGFPFEFPCNLGSYSSSSSSEFSSPVESVVSSTETESDEEEDVLGGLTRLFARSGLQQKSCEITFVPQGYERCWDLSISPQSSLTVPGSLTGRRAAVPTPATTLPAKDSDSWDLIFTAARQAAEIKMDGEDGCLRGRGHLGSLWGLSPAHHYSPSVNNPIGGFNSHKDPSQNQSRPNYFDQARQNRVIKPHCSSILGRPTMEDLINHQNLLHQQLMCPHRTMFENDRHVRHLGSPLSVRPLLQVQHQKLPPQRGGFGMTEPSPGRCGLKTERSGTGVFIPRTYMNPSVLRKKGCPTAPLPPRLVQALNNSSNMTARTLTISDHDTLTAQRNTLLVPKIIPEGTVKHDVSLPQEWTY